MPIYNIFRILETLVTNGNMAKPLQTSHWEVLFLRFHIVLQGFVLYFFTNFNKKNWQWQRECNTLMFLVINYSEKMTRAFAILSIMFLQTLTQN